jgi:hypothetical protein
VSAEDTAQQGDFSRPSVGMMSKCLERLLRRNVMSNDQRDADKASDVGSPAQPPAAGAAVVRLSPLLRAYGSGGVATDYESLYWQSSEVNM